MTLTVSINLALVAATLLRIFAPGNLAGLDSLNDPAPRPIPRGNNRYGNS